MASKSKFISNYRAQIGSLLDNIAKLRGLNLEFELIDGKVDDADFVGENQDINAEIFLTAVKQLSAINESLSVDQLKSFYKLKV